MNEIPLPNIFIHEFFIDIDLVEKALDYFISLENVDSIKTTRSDNSTSVIYPKNSEQQTLSMYHPELFVEIEKCVDTVCEIYLENQKLKISDAWLTKTNFGGNTLTHMHSLSLFSGLLYLTDHERSETVFYVDNPFEKNYGIFKAVLKKREYSYSSKPKKGKLLIWDSHLNHKINTHNDQKTRYTLAFNTFLTGKIYDHPSARLELDLKDSKKQSDDS